MNKDICEYCEIRENGSKYCIGNQTVIVCCGYPSLKKEECLIYKLKTENKELKGKNAQLQCENENLRTAYNDILASCKKEQQENEKHKKALIDIKAMVEFECKCTNEQVCICQVCDKYDAIINKIDGVLNNVEHN